jgi:hypothetical protein
MNQIIIPNTLTITINTSVPGHQILKYKPTMSIKEKKEEKKENKQVFFNPLVKLDSKVIEKVPENIRVSEFFDKGLFQSLVFAHGIQERKTLLEATRAGFIDNNIQQTLDALLPVLGHFYLGEQVYTIADVQWTKGDWRVDIKSIDISELERKTPNKQQVKKLINEEIAKGEKQMQQLPEDTIYGYNYDKKEDDSETEIMKKKNTANPTHNVELPKTKLPSADAQAVPIAEALPISEAVPVAEAVPVSEAETVENAQESTPVETVPAFEETPPVQNVDVQNVEEVPVTSSTEEVPVTSTEEVPVTSTEEVPVTSESNKNVNEKELPIQELVPITEKPETEEEQEEKVEEPVPEEKAEEPVPELPCPSKGIEPTTCIKTSKVGMRQYRKDTLLFHPDKNPGCPEESNKKMQRLNQLCNTFETMFKPELKTSEKSTKQMYEYLNNPNFYFMMDQIFKNMESEEKIKMKKRFFPLIGLDPTKYSIIDKDTYQKMIDILTVEKNSGKGDCFFIALADAINLYNSRLNGEKAEQRILYNHFGKMNPFTQKSLRTIVANYIIKPENTDSFLILGKMNAESLNQLFQQTIQQQSNQNESQYMKQIINDIYSSNDNFLVKITNKEPSINTDFEAFEPIQTTEEIKKYVESPYYWADNSTIEIILKELKINVIVVEKNKGQIQLPFPDLKANEWNKYVFFYYENAHYELITFSNITSANNKVKRGIFEVSGPFIPPIYIVFLLFSLYYVQLNAEDQKQIELFSEYFNFFQDSFERILKKNTDKTFINNFNNTFNTNINSLLNTKYPIFQQLSLSNKAKGGASEKSALSYYITIDLELQKGETISKEQAKEIKCRQKWNAVRKAYAKFTKKKYVIPPVYDYSKETTNNNKTRKVRK